MWRYYREPIRSYIRPSATPYIVRARCGSLYRELNRSYASIPNHCLRTCNHWYFLFNETLWCIYRELRRPLYRSITKKFKYTQDLVTQSRTKPVLLSIPSHCPNYRYHHLLRLKPVTCSSRTNPVLIPNSTPLRLNPYHKAQCLNRELNGSFPANSLIINFPHIIYTSWLYVVVVILMQVLWSTESTWRIMS